VQTVTLTRTGFTARLAIDNKQPLPLTDVTVTLFISPLDNATANATHLFSVPPATLSGLTSTQGGGVLCAA
jgi:hypothetical protein